MPREVLVLRQRPAARAGPGPTQAGAHVSALLDAPPRPFDLLDYLSGVDERLLAVPEGRRVLTRLEPLLFALVYLPHHLKGRETGEEITLSEFHLDLIAHAKRWVLPDTEPAQHRDAYIAPRGSGKSTWLFLVLPLWAAAHNWRSFIAAFAHSAGQAEMHLATLKHELDTNAALRTDFPELCTPSRRPGGMVQADRAGMLVTKAGFTFAARGIDAASLGMKVGERRPDLLILDDVEPGEESYSPYLKDKRLGTLLDSILPLNVYARVVIVGTVTMHGSIVHDLVRSATETGPAEPWVTDEHFRAHYYPAILTDPQTGAERSIWPAKWSMDYLQSIRHTRSFKKNYQNDPMGADGEFWREDDFTHATTPGFTHQLLSIDPAVTAKGTSDYTALAVIGYYAPEKVCVVRDAWNLRIPPGEELRRRVLAILATYPGIAGVLVESNQGGEAWRAILNGLPVPVRTVHQHAPKEVRAAKLLNHYQRHRVLHEKRLPDVEGQMVSFPKGAYDDLVDAVGSGVAVFLDPKKQAGVSAGTYL